MIDLDEYEEAIIFKQELECGGVIAVGRDDLLHVIDRLRQAEKDAARYRSAVSMLGEASEMLQLLSLSVSKVSERNMERIDAVVCEIDAELSQCSK